MQETPQKAQPLELPTTGDLIAGGLLGLAVLVVCYGGGGYGLYKLLSKIINL